MSGLFELEDDEEEFVEMVLDGVDVSHLRHDDLADFIRDQARRAL